jgi:hypothetical protein
MPDDHTQVVMDEIQRALIERQQHAATTMMQLYGGQQKYFDACRRARAADRDLQLARIVLRLLRAGGDPGSLRCHRIHMEILEAEPDVLAYWRSVAAAGQEGWREERQRVKAAEQAAANSNDSHERALVMDVNAIKALMPTYRAWGRLLLIA